jgi:pimeloyl-ACP methyl ester carboxylesterase
LRTARVTSDDHLLELPEGRTIGYATWGDPEGTPVFIGHGTPGSRLDRYTGLDEWYAGFAAEVPEVDRRVLERPEVRAIAIEMFQEAVRQGAVGWVEDALRLRRPWSFRLDEIGADVSFHHGEDDTLAPPQYANELAEGIPGSRLRLYPGEGHCSILDRPIKEIVETLLAP